MATSSLALTGSFVGDGEGPGIIGAILKFQMFKQYESFKRIT